VTTPAIALPAVTLAPVTVSVTVPDPLASVITLPKISGILGG